MPIERGRDYFDDLCIEQSSHGFTLPSYGFLPLYYNNVSGRFEEARADDITTSADVIAIDFPDNDTIIIQNDGFIDCLNHGLDIGKWYVLDETTAGNVVAFDTLTGTDKNVQYLAFPIDDQTIVLRADPIFTRDFFIPQDISILEDWADSPTTSVTLTTGDNRMLLFKVSWEDDGTANGVSSVTIGGVAGTLVEEQIIVSGFSAGCHVFRWSETDISSMSGNTISLTWSSGTPNSFAQCTALLEHVDQTTPVVDTNTDSGTGGTDTLDADVTSISGGYVFLVANGGNTGMGFTNNGAGWTRKLNLVYASADGVLDDKLISSGASPENVNMGITGSNRHVMVASSFRRQE